MIVVIVVNELHSTKRRINVVKSGYSFWAQYECQCQNCLNVKRLNRRHYRKVFICEHSAVHFCDTVGYMLVVERFNRY